MNGWTAIETASTRLRVVQTGVQLLTGFLLTLPFQQRFNVLGPPMRLLYLATVACAVCTPVHLLVRPSRHAPDAVRRHRLQCSCRRHTDAPLPGWRCPVWR